MLEAFKNQILKLTGNESPNLILGVSGGVDSMVLLHLCHLADFEIQVAHMNFQLRGEESDGDETFVQQFCQEKNISFISKRVDTAEVSAEAGTGIQETARELRYSWFHELADETEKPTFIVTAHHFDDTIETTIINMMRGTGIKGITGIPAKNGIVIRPMLNLTRQEIEEYADKMGIEHREDSSNASNKYLRNRIRHFVLPALEEADENFRQGFSKTLDQLSKVTGFLDLQLNKWKSQNVQMENGFLRIAKQAVCKDSSAEPLVWEFFSQYGFSSAQMDEILKLCDAQPGRSINCNSSTLTTDRDFFILTPNKPAIGSGQQWEIADLQGKIEANGVFVWEEKDVRDVFLSASNDTVVLDRQKLKFPLTLRPWQAGDAMNPLGMKGSKKVSDILTDLKVPLPLKARTLVLISGEEIVWLVGYRISDHFKVTPATRRVLQTAWRPA